MNKIKLIQLVNSFVVLPILTMSGASSGPISQAVMDAVNNHPSVVILQKESDDKVAAEVAKAAEVEALAKASAIDEYFKKREMPLGGMGMKMVQEAQKNGLDWRLLPAIAVRESSGGKNACKNNAFGWGSCKIGFKSNEEAIETVARNIGGNNPKTAHYYDNKTVKQILNAYNPPSIVPRYTEQVISIMNAIGIADEVVVTSNTTT